MNTVTRNSFYSGSRLFWLFIFLSVLAHITFLLINGPETTSQPPVPVAKAPLQIKLQDQAKLEPVIPKDIAKVKPAASTPEKAVTAIAKPSKPALKPSAKETLKSEIAQTKEQPIKSGILIRADALQWLQQQAKEYVSPQPEWQQLVSLGDQGSAASEYDQYQNTAGETIVVFNTGVGRICGKARPADPLDSFDQGSWTVGVNCNL